MQGPRQEPAFSFKQGLLFPSALGEVASIVLLDLDRKRQRNEQPRIWGWGSLVGVSFEQPNSRWGAFLAVLRRNDYKKGRGGRAQHLRPGRGVVPWRYEKSFGGLDGTETPGAIECV